MNAADKESLENYVAPYFNSLDRRLGSVEGYLRDDLPDAIKGAVHEHQESCVTTALQPMKTDVTWLVEQHKAAEARRAYRRSLTISVAKLTAYVGTLAGAIIAIVKVIETLAG